MLNGARYPIGTLGVLRLWSVLSLCLLMLLTPLEARADITLTFGTYAADKPTVTVKKYRPFLTFLSNRLGEVLDEKVVIRMTVAKEYQEGIDQLANGEVDFARFGPASYIHVMKQNPQVQIVAMESKKGSKRFQGVIVVHRDSTITKLSDLAGLSFAFGDELSTIGRYLAQSHLLEAGIDSKDLHTYEYLGRHDLVGEAVGAGKFTAGALKESTYKKLIAKGVPIRVLASFDNVTKPWLASSNLPEDVLLAMRQIMLSSDNEEIVRRVSKNGFLQGADSDYDLIRDAMEQSQAF
ncbi:PhnD/SsuA/transferrin family substrate-binding protein [Phaeobacter porticola]|uniref:ABC-type phosphate/phosphonate transport system, periplasmic component n=1 Tax=Phaeobacter porticola TaxID=1844006 RepID=A0A1L3IAP1_9RHOB|nr:PhnD/SsuA/transferrin family substrate-binding protein [Phaeobacter porticola]APG49103.1 ABC-type phosphate/phosphonate transport system, periplasmic component [Phaeobacter porticola]